MLQDVKRSLAEPPIQYGGKDLGELNIQMTKSQAHLATSSSTGEEFVDENEICQLAIEQILTEMNNWADWTIEQGEKLE